MEKDGGLRALFKLHLKEPHWTPIETSAITSGTPDLEGCWNGSQVWVETKRTDGWKVELRASQRGWILRRTNAGGRVWIATRQLGRDRDDLWLTPGAYVRELGNDGLRDAHHSFHFQGGSRNWPWDTIKLLLFTDRQ